ncbi:hypothetical protein ACFPRL_36620 [Pseudoclavibacter helvolus]
MLHRDARNRACVEAVTHGGEPVSGVGHDAVGDGLLAVCFRVVVNRAHESQHLPNHGALRDHALTPASGRGDDHRRARKGLHVHLRLTLRLPVGLRGTRQCFGCDSEVSGGLLGGIRPCSQDARGVSRNPRPCLAIFDRNLLQTSNRLLQLLALPLPHLGVDFLRLTPRRDGATATVRGLPFLGSIGCARGGIRPLCAQPRQRQIAAHLSTAVPNRTLPVGGSRGHRVARHDVRSTVRETWAHEQPDAAHAAHELPLVL